MGRANWWLPGWLDRLLPHLTLDGDDHKRLIEEALGEFDFSALSGGNGNGGSEGGGQPGSAPSENPAGGSS